MQTPCPDPPTRFTTEPPLDWSKVSSVLVVGGTFDPPHRAHVRLATQAAAALQCDHVIFIPVRQSPHKLDEPPPTPGEHRYEMLMRALKSLPPDSGISVSRFEIDRPAPSYTVDTLEAIRQELPANSVIRILFGADQVLSFDRWHRWERILELATPAVLLRPPYITADSLIEAGMPANRRVWVIEGLELLDTAATNLRSRIAAGESNLSDEIDEGVLEYIKKHGLYR
jgi:nicotinate-nucleotide adenylyltransferase